MITKDSSYLDDVSLDDEDSIVRAVLLGDYSFTSIGNKLKLKPTNVSRLFHSKCKSNNSKMYYLIGSRTRHLPVWMFKDFKEYFLKRFAQ